MPISLSTILIGVAALGGVLCLILVVARGLRAAGLVQPQTGQRLKVRETLALDRTRRLYVIVCDKRELLVLTGGASEQMLGWLPEPGVATGALAS